MDVYPLCRVRLIRILEGVLKFLEQKSGDMKIV